jgi:chemotaxis protein MotB
VSTVKRRAHEESHENHERWLVSYADFITLMFAFFVVMFATSQSDKAKAKAVSDAVETALHEDKFSAKIKNVLQGKPDPKSQPGNPQTGLYPAAKPADPPEKLAELTPSFKKLASELKKEIEAGLIEVNLEPRGLVISLKEGAFFATGDATVNVSRLGTIAKLATTVKLVPNPVRLEGHTDSTPISNSRFHSNWELSAARSIAVLEVLRDKFSVPQSRMAIVGYGDTIAYDTNATEEGRARNRRVDITILNEGAALGAAKSHPAVRP